MLQTVTWEMSKRHVWGVMSRGLILKSVIIIMKHIAAVSVLVRGWDDEKPKAQELDSEQRRHKRLCRRKTTGINAGKVPSWLIWMLWWDSFFLLSTAQKRRHTSTSIVYLFVYPWVYGRVSPLQGFIILGHLYPTLSLSHSVPSFSGGVSNNRAPLGLWIITSSWLSAGVGSTGRIPLGLWIITSSWLPAYHPFLTVTYLQAAEHGHVFWHRLQQRLPPVYLSLLILSIRRQL